MAIGSRTRSPAHVLHCGPLDWRELGAAPVQADGAEFMPPSDGIYLSGQEVRLARAEVSYRLIASRAGVAPTASSPADAMSSAPVRFSTSFARVISSAVSQCTDSRTPPSLTRPSYRLASYSGISVSCDCYEVIRRNYEQVGR
jgi:hypothetical protein